MQNYFLLPDNMLMQGGKQYAEEPHLCTMGASGTAFLSLT